MARLYDIIRKQEYPQDPFLIQLDTWTLYRRWDPYLKTWDRGNLACEAPGYNVRMLETELH